VDQPREVLDWTKVDRALLRSLLDGTPEMLQIETPAQLDAYTKTIVSHMSIATEAAMAKRLTITGRSRMSWPEGQTTAVGSHETTTGNKNRARGRNLMMPDLQEKEKRCRKILGDRRKKGFQDYLDEIIDNPARLWRACKIPKNRENPRLAHIAAMSYPRVVPRIA
jgi:hypothetical protein